MNVGKLRRRVFRARLEAKRGWIQLVIRKGDGKVDAEARRFHVDKGKSAYVSKKETERTAALVSVDENVKGDWTLVGELKPNPDEILSSNMRLYDGS